MPLLYLLESNSPSLTARHRTILVYISTLYIQGNRMKTHSVKTCKITLIS